MFDGSGARTTFSAALRNGAYVRCAPRQTWGEVWRVRARLGPVPVTRGHSTRSKPGLDLVDALLVPPQACAERRTRHERQALLLRRLLVEHHERCACAARANDASLLLQLLQQLATPGEKQSTSCRSRLRQLGGTDAESYFSAYAFKRSVCAAIACSSLMRPQHQYLLRRNRGSRSVSRERFRERRRSVLRTSVVSTTTPHVAKKLAMSCSVAVSGRLDTCGTMCT